MVPAISVIVPILQEEKYIATTLPIKYLISINMFKGLINVI